MHDAHRKLFFPTHFDSSIFFSHTYQGAKNYNVVLTLLGLILMAKNSIARVTILIGVSDPNILHFLFTFVHVS